MSGTSPIASLRRHQVLTLLGVVLAGTIGFALATGRLAAGLPAPNTATLQVLLRTRGSSPLDLDPSVVGGLPARAQLIGDLMAAEPTRPAIERDAGLTPGMLTVVTPDTGEIMDPVPIAVQAVTAAAPKTADILTVKADGASPIITLSGQGLTRAAAVRTVTAGARGLDQLIASGAGPHGTGLAVVRLGGPGAHGGGRPSRLPTGAAAALVFLALWCGAIVAGTRRRPGGWTLDTGGSGAA